MILVYVTYKNKKEAEKIVGILLKERLIAGANVFPVKSAYWWKGKIEKASEYVSILKTAPKNWMKIQTAVKRIHSYETPFIAKISAHGTDEIEEWVKSESR